MNKVGSAAKVKLNSFDDFFGVEQPQAGTEQVQEVTQFPDVVIRLFAVVIFVMLDVISSTKYDVIMNMSFINVCGENIRIFPL